MRYEEELVLPFDRLEELNQALDPPLCQIPDMTHPRGRALGAILDRLKVVFSDGRNMQLWILNTSPEPSLCTVLTSPSGQRLATDDRVEGPIEGTYLLCQGQHEYVLRVGEGQICEPDAE